MRGTLDHQETTIDAGCFMFPKRDHIESQGQQNFPTTLSDANFHPRGTRERITTGDIRDDGRVMTDGEKQATY